ncbi:MAG: hypothetical protein HC800_14395 [Phormidesmis sp. RL_2_1]|nr:hypothetical protein [Phormidesmis sp. RL_2_1]
MNIFTILDLWFPDRLTTNLAQGRCRLAVASVFGAAALGTATLGLGSVGATAAAASLDYFDCATGMTAAGIAQADAIAACAAARYPEDLGACVVDVSDLTGLTAESALIVCGRSRRPLEVANCTIDIHTAFLDSPSTKVLENCGRSLLPARYGTCVIDIVEATEIAVDEALTQCIRAGYRPWRIQPRL